MQICSKCGIEKSYNDFRKRKDTITGYRKDCKECCKKRDSEYYENNKETFKSHNKEYYKNNKEQINNQHKEYWKEYYANNKEKVLAYHQEYRNNNTDICKERISKWKATERGRICCIMKEGKRRAIKKSTTDNSVTIDNTKELLIKQNYTCTICGIDLNTTPKHLDHIIPLSKGGAHSINNLQWLCAKCNLKKSNKFIIN